MTTFRNWATGGFTVMSNETLNRGDLSFLAKGILAFYLSKPSDWHPRSSHLQQVSPYEGEQRLARAVNELIDHGFYRRTRNQDHNGHWHTSVEITDRPFQFDDYTKPEPDDLEPDQPDADPPGPRFPGVGERGPGNPRVLISTEDKELKTKRSRAHSARPPATADEHAPPARVIGGNGSAPAAANGTANGTGNGAATGVPRRIRQPDRKPPGPDTGGGLVEHFTALADRHGVNGPMEISAGALGRNLSSWLRQGMDAEEVRALMDAFYAGRDGWRGDTPLWRRFIGDAYRLRQNRRRTEVDYTAGMEVVSESRFSRWEAEQTANGAAVNEQGAIG